MAGSSPALFLGCVCVVEPWKCCQHSGVRVKKSKIHLEVKGGMGKRD